MFAGLTAQNRPITAVIRNVDELTSPSRRTETQVGTGIIEEVEKKAEILQNKFKNKSIQKVLISASGATKFLIASGFFYRIIRPDEFFDQV